MTFSLIFRKFIPAAAIAAGLFLGYPKEGNDVFLPSYPLENSEVVCMAQTIFFEARGEPQESRLGVALVVMNRAYELQDFNGIWIRDTKPLSICSVVHKKIHGRCAFSYYCLKIYRDFKFHSVIDRQSWDDAVIFAKYVERCYNRCMVDITQGATFYDSNLKYAPWERNLTYTVSLGHHKFFRKP